MSTENKEFYKIITSDIQLVFNYYKNNATLFNMLLIDEKKDNNKTRSLHNEDYGNKRLNKRILNSCPNNDNNLKNNLNDNLKIDFAKEEIKLESSESDTKSCLEESFSFKTKK